MNVYLYEVAVLYVYLNGSAVLYVCMYVCTYVCMYVQT